LFFEIGFVVTTALTWQDAFDLLPLFGLMIAGYASWQENKWILRTGYILNALIFLAYKSIIGAWIAVATEGIGLIAATIGLIYYCVWEQEKPLLEYFDFLKISKRKKSKNKFTKARRTKKIITKTSICLFF